VVTGSPAPANNASSLALGNQLSYARSYKTKCSEKTGTVSLSSASSSPKPGSGSDSSSNTGSSGSGSDSVSGSGSGSNTGASTNSGSPATGNNGPGSSPADSGQPVGSAGVCGPQQTVTVTSQTTVTVTQVAQAAGSASANVAPADSESAASTGSKDSPNTSSSDSSHGGQAAAASGLSAPIGNASSASVSSTSDVNGYSSGSPSSGLSSPGSLNSGSPGSRNVSSGITGFGNVGLGNTGSGNTGSGNSGNGNLGSGNSGSGNTGSGNAGSGNTGSGNSGSGNTGSGNSGSGNTGSGNSGSRNLGNGDSGSGNSASGTSASGVSDSGPYYSNATVSGSASPSGTGNSLAPRVEATVSNSTSNANLDGQFWAGADIGTLIRMEAIPQRVFYDYDGKTVKDPIKTLADAGVNAIRVEATRGQCLGPTNFVNDGSTLGDELLFQLDWGCIDIQVKTAMRSVAQGMRVVLTINQGFDIPVGMESYTYKQMVDEVQKETKRQLQPFLDAKIVPDVILFENEGSDGFLFNETATGHIRGNNDGKVPVAQVDKEKCGTIPTGNMNSFPQYAGYLKAEVISCNDAITAAGFSTAAVRYGLHSHGQYVQWKEGVVHGPNAADQSNLIDTSGKSCSNAVIPQNLLSQNVSEILTIMGFSAYPDPMTPIDINSKQSERDTFNRTLTTLTQMMGYAEAYGKYESGPFAGEYKLQALGVEYGTSYTYDQIPQEQQETAMMWSLVKQFPNVLGMMWYEPWYCHADWEGGKAALCHNVGTGDISGQAATDTLKTWGSAAQSPWKK